VEFQNGKFRGGLDAKIVSNGHLRIQRQHKIEVINEIITLEQLYYRILNLGLSYDYEHPFIFCTGYIDSPDLLVDGGRTIFTPLFIEMRRFQNGTEYPYVYGLVTSAQQSSGSHFVSVLHALSIAPGSTSRISSAVVILL